MKFLRCLLILSSLCITTCTENKKLDERPAPSDELTRKLDSVNMQDADMVMETIVGVLNSHKDSITVKQAMSIHVILQTVLQDKLKQSAKLDKINDQLDILQKNVDEYVKKKVSSATLKRQLLVDIQHLKTELSEIKPRTLKEIVQKPIPNSLKTLVDLDPGNYQMRTDKKHILRFHVTDTHEIFIAPLMEDSTTVLNGAPLDPKVLEQIKALRKNLNN